MKIVFDEINKIKKLDKKYDKLTGSDNTEKKAKLGDKITSLRSTVVEEFNRRKDKYSDHETSFLDDHEDESGEGSKWDAKSQKLDDRLADLDALLDPSLITADDSEEAEPTNERHGGRGKGGNTDRSERKAEREAKREERKANRGSGA